MPNRDRYGIIIGILRLLHTGPVERRTVTGMMFEAYTSHEMLKEYIGFLKESQWIELVGKKQYGLTLLGEKKLELLEGLNRIWPFQGVDEITVPAL